LISKQLDLYFPNLTQLPGLKIELERICYITTFKPGTVILEEGSHINVIPLMLNGLAKVFKEEDNGQEVLL